MAAARVMGEFAFGQGREQAERAVRQAGDQAGQTLSIVGGLTGKRPSSSRAAPTPTPTPERRQASPAPTPPPPAPEGAAARAEASADTGGNGRVPGPKVESLAIPGYDTLSASQVVQRLNGLSAEELEAVRAYEESGRKRKTILARVQQLQSGS